MTQLIHGRFLPAELHCSLRNAAVLLVAFALVLAVATRYTNYSSSGQNSGPAVHRTIENKRQHIEKTSFLWLAAPSNPVRFKPPVTPQLVIVHAPILKVPYGENLYNRPPPSLS